MAKWYYYNESGEKIEVTGGQLKGLAKAGRITPETIVETEDGKKARAGKVKGLTFITPDAISPEPGPPKPAQPVEQEIYGVAVPPPKPSPFTASMPVAATTAAPSPFTQTIPVPTSVSFTATEQTEIDKLFAQSGRVDMPMLHRAAFVGNIEVARFLISKGADVNAKDEFWGSPLHKAALGGNVAITQFLVSSGAIVNTYNEYGILPLHTAASMGNVAVAQFLISVGADVNAKTHNDKTSLDMAKKAGHTAMVQYLTSAGGTATKPQSAPNNNPIPIFVGLGLGLGFLLPILSRFGVVTPPTAWSTLAWIIFYGICVLFWVFMGLGGRYKEAVAFSITFFIACAISDDVKVENLVGGGSSDNMIAVKVALAFVEAVQRNEADILDLKHDWSENVLDEINFLPATLYKTGSNVLDPKSEFKHTCELVQYVSYGEHIYRRDTYVKYVDIDKTANSVKGVNSRLAPEYQEEHRKKLHELMRLSIEEIERAGGKVSSTSIPAAGQAMEQPVNQPAPPVVANQPEKAPVSPNAAAIKRLEQTATAIADFGVALLGDYERDMDTAIQEFLNADSPDYSPQIRTEHKKLWKAMISVKIAKTNHSGDRTTDLLFLSKKTDEFADSVERYSLLRDKEIERLKSGGKVSETAAQSTPTTKQPAGGVQFTAEEQKQFTAEERAEIEKFCANNGSDVKAVDKDGKTLLHKAVVNGNIVAVKFLVARGADVHAKAKDDFTPLHFTLVASERDVEIAQFLVSKGADINAKGMNDATPLDLAKVMNKTAMVEYLESIGAKSGQ